MEEGQKVPKHPRKHDLPKGAVPRGIAEAGAVAGLGRTNITESPPPPSDELVDSNAFEIVKEDLARVAALCLPCHTDFFGLTEKANVPRDFIGMIRLPILSNDVMAIQRASKDKMDIAIQSALGKNIQTALVVAPTLVLVGWIMGLDDVNLLFDGFQVSAL
ncbi:Vacuolar calcium ion transporter 1 [Botrytis cinerea]